MTPIHIRSAELKDLPELLRIYNHAVVHGTATFDLEEQTLEQRTEWFSHYVGVHPLLVAETEDGRITGYGSLSQFRAKRAYDQTVEHSIYLDPEFQGQGIGRQMLEELIRQAAALGHHSMIACITEGNEASVKLHENNGFTLIGRFPEVGYKFDAWQTVLFYQLIL